MNDFPLHSVLATYRGEEAAICVGFTAQPIVDLRNHDRAVLYSECLTRMMVAERLLLMGGDVFHFPEESSEIGLLDAITASMIMDALANEPHVRLGCNISPGTLADGDSWFWLMHCIGERAWLTGRLTLEFTESRPLREIHGVAERLREAKRLGCRLAIDDFGIGSAASTQLRTVDVEWDVIKIARSCFGDLRKTPSGRDGLRSLVALAGCIAPIVVVDGIETRAHLALARTAGVKFGQGSIFDRPAPQRWTVLNGQQGDRLVRAMMAHNPDLLLPDDLPGGKEKPKPAWQSGKLDQALRRTLAWWGGRR